MSRRIDSERGTFYVSDFDLGLRSLKENGFNYAFSVTVNGKRREVWDKAESVTKHKFVLRMETLDRLDVPAEVKEHIADYLVEHSLGDLVYVGRASNHPEDHYLYEVATKMADGTYACWTSWNEDRQSLNFGHTRLKTFADAMSVLYEFYHDIDKED